MTSRLNTAKSRFIMLATWARGTVRRKPGRDIPFPPRAMMSSALISVVIASLAGRPHRVGDARETVACSEAFEAARDSSREARPLEHHRRIDLHQAGPGADAVPRLFGGEIGGAHV